MSYDLSRHAFCRHQASFFTMLTAVGRAAVMAAVVTPSTSALAQLVINEIDYDQPGTDQGEFIEIYNAGATSQNLSGYTLDLVNGSGGAIYTTVVLNAVDLPAGGFYVVCENSADVANCNQEGISSIQNGAPDAVALLSGGMIVDTVSYEGDVPGYTEGSGVGLVDDSSGGAGGINEYKSISRLPDGNDTDSNNTDFTHQCMSPGFANLTTSSDCMPPAAPKIVINEIDYQELGVTDNEFIELYNSGNTPLNIGLYSIELIDGATASSYASIALPNITLNPGDYYVICGTSAVTTCDLNTGLGNDFVQNGSPDAVALRTGAILADVVSYDGSVAPPWVEGSGAGLVDTDSSVLSSISRFPNGADTDQNNVDFSARCATPGTANTVIFSNCTGGTAVEIWAIQGNGLSSPVDGQLITTEDNIVTGVGPEGFFMQTPAARSDGDADTSDGIYVFTGGTPTVAVGDQVDVTGFIDEFFDFTEFTGSPLVSIDSNGNALPPVVMLDSSTPSPLQPQSAIELERFEGMRVSMVGVTTGANDNFGDTPVTAASQRTFREPGIEYPGLPGLPVWDGNPEIFEINANELGLPEVNFVGGQSVIAEGPLAYSFGDYQIWPTFVSAGSAPPLPRAVRAREAGEFTIAMQNFFRIFDNIDDPVVDDAVIPLADYQTRLLKASRHIIDYLGAPDVVAVQEIEKLAVLDALAAQIAADQPGLIYNTSLLEGNDVGGIDVGYLTRADTISVNSVTQNGLTTLLSFDGSLLNDRPPLIMEADYIGNGAPFAFTVINVHQRSLGGIEGGEATRVKTKRLEQAQELAQLIQDLQTADPNIKLVVIGDFNAFEFTDGYVDVMGQVTGLLDPLGDEFATTDIIDPNLTNQTLSLPAEERYSFVFRGNAQALDHAVTSQGIDPYVRGFQFARGNADVAANLLLETGPGAPPIADNSTVRSADHDGGVLYIISDADADGVADDMDNCTLVANPDQHDSNGDNFGNICDPDLNNNGVVNFIDYSILTAAFLSTPGDANWNPDADLDNNGTVNFIDFSIFPDYFLESPGPSGLVP